MCKTTVKTFNADVKINGLGKGQKNQMSQVVNKSEKEQNFWQPYSTVHILGFSSEFTAIEKSYFAVLKNNVVSHCEYHFAL